MKGKVTWEPRTLNRGEFHLRGYFDTNESSNPTTYVGGGLTSVTRTAAGTFKLTFNTCAKRIVGAYFGFGNNTPGQFQACIDLDGSDITATSGGSDAGYVLLKLYDTPTDAVTEAAGTRVFFDILCQDYAVQP